MRSSRTWTLFGAEFLGGQVGFERLLRIEFQIVNVPLSDQLVHRRSGNSRPHGSRSDSAAESGIRRATGFFIIRLQWKLIPLVLEVSNATPRNADGPAPGRLRRLNGLCETHLRHLTVRRGPDESTSAQNLVRSTSKTTWNATEKPRLQLNEPHPPSSLRHVRQRFSVHLAGSASCWSAGIASR